MKKAVLIVLSLVTALSACRREAPAPEGTAGPTVTETTLTGPPQDMRDADIRAAISPDKGRFVIDSRVGPLGTDGLVSEEKTEFASDDPIHLTMWLKESPTGLQTSARLEDASGNAVDTQLRAMKGEKTVTFSLGNRKLPPGKYKITGYWGGNVAAEHDIVVRQASAPQKPAPKSKAPGKGKGTATS